MKAIFTIITGLAVLAACSPAPPSSHNTETEASSAKPAWQPDPQLVRAAGPSPFGNRAALIEQRAIHAAEAELASPKGLDVIASYVVSSAHVSSVTRGYQRRFAAALWSETHRQHALPMATLDAWDKGNQRIAIIITDPYPPKGERLLIILRPR